MELKQFFMEHPKVAIAFSGGVDSAYLLYAAAKCGTQVKAYYVKSDFQPQFELDDGVNYFDTAYPYHGGESERVIGRVLSEYPRDSYYLATKYPGHEIISTGYNPAEFFEEQLNKVVWNISTSICCTMFTKSLWKCISPPLGHRGLLQRAKETGAPFFGSTLTILTICLDSRKARSMRGKDWNFT